jgi:uncharacterized protein YdhG (YjbR/CyaY superfamily)
MSVIDDYLSKIDEPKKTELEKIRAIVHGTLNDCEEVISYGMPAFKYQGKYLIGFNSFKDHLSLFPTSEPIERMKNELKDFKTSRGTIQFSVEHPISEDLIRKLIKIRAQNISKEFS